MQRVWCKAETPVPCRALSAALYRAYIAHCFNIYAEAAGELHTEVSPGQAKWTSARARKPCQQTVLRHLEETCICFSLKSAPGPRSHTRREGHRRSICIYPPIRSVKQAFMADHIQTPAGHLLRWLYGPTPCKVLLPGFTLCWNAIQADPSRLQLTIWTTLGQQSCVLYLLMHGHGSRCCLLIQTAA